MIRIGIDWQAMTVEASGHAGHGPRGQDIVCAGVSALLETLLARWMLLGADPGKQDAGNGYMRIAWEPGHERSAEARESLATIALGLRLISETYPDRVEISAGGTGGLGTTDRME